MIRYARLVLYQFNTVWEPRPVCAPDIKDAVPTGPDHQYNVYFDISTNTCDARPDQDRNRGTMYAQCVSWSWEVVDGCTGKGADPETLLIMPTAKSLVGPLAIFLHWDVGFLQSGNGTAAMSWGVDVCSVAQPLGSSKF